MIARSAVSRSKTWLHKRASAVVLIGALGFLGVAYTVFADAGSAETGTETASAQDGQKLFERNCTSCHGVNAQGIEGRGPSLLGVGKASVEFQVGTGRMPMAQQEAQAPRKQKKLNSEETQALAAYVDSLSSQKGPEIPEGSLRKDEEMSEGGRLFRLNCASCHSFGGGGGALSGGKQAPTLDHATDRQLYAAMLTGPQNMPVFGDNQLTPDQKRAVISYVQGQKEDQAQGGNAIGKTGPVPEGLVIFGVGMVVLIFASLWIAGKS